MHPNQVFLLNNNDLTNEDKAPQKQGQQGTTDDNVHKTRIKTLYFRIS
jgi:hypothetical protein